MKDNYGRDIDYMRISVTENCNLNCFYCKPETKSTQKYLSDDEIVNIVKASIKQGITKFRITGGEPLVRKGIYSLISQIKKVHGVTELTLTTNGILLQGNVRKLRESGIDRINLSLDSLRSKDYQNITKFSKTFDFDSLIREILAENLVPLKINVVLLRGINDDQIDEFIELTDKYNILIRFIELMDIGDLDFNYQKHYISCDEIIRRIPNIQKESAKGNTTYYSIPTKNGMIGFINPVSKKFCESCNRLRLTADGNIRPCLHFDDEFKVKNVAEYEVEEVIRNAILSKPKEHELDNEDGSRSKRSMNQIGG